MFSKHCPVSSKPSRLEDLHPPGRRIRDLQHLLSPSLYHLTDKTSVRSPHFNYAARLPVPPSPDEFVDIHLWRQFELRQLRTMSLSRSAHASYRRAQSWTQIDTGLAVSLTMLKVQHTIHYSWVMPWIN
ncbi:hypothetical protein CPB85DRAFT_460003 [Mucidula mucida]|nr:hypothetical protein CPB85DRAFT_460003 [Mucidula mucida]